MKNTSVHQFVLAPTLALLSMLVLVGFGFSVDRPTASASRSVSRMHPAAMLSSSDVAKASEDRAELLTQVLTVSFTGHYGTEVASTTVKLADHPSWIINTVDLAGKNHTVVDEKKIHQYLISYPIEGIPVGEQCSLLREWTDPQAVIRADTDCFSRDGYTYDTKKLADVMKTAFEKGDSTVLFSLTFIPAKLVGTASDGLVRGELSLLATGRSDFKGSGAGRKANVKKALTQHVNNVVVPEGAQFSFNALLGDAVSIKRGWFMALTIFDGKDLRMAPGGGICQASTTVYRAALAAGLPILKQRSHSLFVTYYEKYGVGQDATVFLGQQDFVFLNDTPGPLVIQSGYNGDEAFVNIFGIDDHRSVVLSGPYFASNDPGDLREKKLRVNEIGWSREVTLASGEVKTESFIARYKSIPKSLVKRSPLTVTQVRGGVNVAEHMTVAEQR